MDHILTFDIEVILHLVAQVALILHLSAANVSRDFETYIVLVAIDQQTLSQIGEVSDYLGKFPAGHLYVH